MSASLKILGDWSQQIDVPLNDALSVGMQLSGESGAKACKRAILYMANAAKNLTKQSPKKRAVMKDSDNREYLETYAAGYLRKLYRFQFTEKEKAKNGLWGTFDEARVIGARGMAKRSWFWSMGRIFKGQTGRRGIPGVTSLYTLLTPKACGYEYANRLGYILKAIPAGWEPMVHAQATQRILAGEANKLVRKFGVSMKQIGKATGLKHSRDIYRWFVANTPESQVPT